MENVFIEVKLWVELFEDVKHFFQWFYQKLILAEG